EPQVYIKRAWYHFSRASVEILKDGSGAKDALSRLAADLSRAAELNPEDSLAVGSAAYWETFSSWTVAGGLQGAIKLKKPGVNFDWLIVFLKENDLWDKISEGNKKSVMMKLKALEHLGQRNDARAAVAAEMLAYFQLKIIGDFGSAAKSFEQLVMLDPQN